MKTVSLLIIDMESALNEKEKMLENLKKLRGKLKEQLR